MKHALVTPKSYFEEVVSGARTADIKKDDRPYGQGDEIILQEYDEAKKLYTGREVSLNITTIARNIPREGLRRGFVFICFSTGTVIQNTLPAGYGVAAATTEDEHEGPEADHNQGQQSPESAAAVVEVDSLKDLPDFLKDGDKSAEQLTGTKGGNTSAKKGG